MSSVAQLADVRIEEALIRRASTDGGALAVEDMDRVVTYAELLGAALAARDLIVRSGARPGDQISVFLDKSLEAVAYGYGVWLAGGVLVPIAPTLRRQHVEYILSHSESRLLLSTEGKLRRSGFEVMPANLVPVVEVRAAESLPELQVSETSGPAALLYTSGSTGMPKGVIVSHENLCAGSRIVSSYLGIQSADRILSVLPFSFDYGLNQLLTSVRNGAALVLQRSLLATDILRNLRDQRITILAGVPTLWGQLLDTGLIGPDMAPTLRLITNSGGVFPVESVRRYRELLPSCKVFLMYGLTEAFRSTYLPPDQLETRPESMGKAIPETEIFILGPDNRETAPGEPGELVHRGPTVALGYWRDPAATAAKYRPDPLDPTATRPVVYSGDVVRRDAEGFLYFVGRNDEMLKAYGYRISPSEVEAIAMQSQMVREVVADGVADPIAGTRVVLHCVPGEQFSLEGLMAYCQKEMPSYMIPKTITVHEEFPRTSSGKLDRARVKKRES